jgi:hypothetical protein
MENPNLLSEELKIDAESHSHLLETAKWAKFLGIVGFIICAVIVLLSIFAASFMAALTGGGALGAPVPAGLGMMMSVMYFIIAVIYFALSLYVYRFAVKMKQALLGTDQLSFNQGLYHLKMVYRISGIIMIIYLGLMVIGLILTLAAAAFS